MKYVVYAVLVMFGLTACGGGSQKEQSETVNQIPVSKEYDQNRGIGKFKNVELDEHLDVAMANEGAEIYNGKCAACHRLTEERLVGPGWKGVTDRRTAEWIMNFTTNTEEMIDKDPEVQAQLEICLVRMPNQNVSDEDARSVYEFMRKNDGVQ